MIHFPPTLKKGDKIAIISPAGAVKFEQIESTLELIKNKGYEPVLSPHCLGTYDKGYLYSGTEKERIADLNWAFSQQEAKAIWATRGGYGCQHLLRHLKLSKFRTSPKWYIGYSDNTVIQSYLLKNGFASIHGQTLKTSSFGVTEDSFEAIFSIFKGKTPNYNITPHPLNQKGSAEGILVGGNLSLIYALLSSRYSFDFKDKILFIEEIGENFYALDRMMVSLDLAGVFRKIKGLVVGGMIYMGNEKDNPQYEESFDAMAYQIISERVKHYDFPILYSFPNGHIHHNLPLIIGKNMTLEVSKQQITFK